MVLDTGERCAASKQPGLGLQMRDEVEADLVLLLACVREEVLYDPDQAIDLNWFAQFFQHFPLEGFGCALAKFNPTTRQGPERVAFQLVQQDLVLVDHDRRCSQIEAVRFGLKGDHAL
jgi:hypothetical protein